MPARRITRPFLVAALVGGMVGGAGVTAPSSATVTPGVAPELFPSFNILSGVLASSPDEAHAVGVGGPVRARATVWDGERWESTNPPGRVPSELYDVTEIDGRVWASGGDVGEGLVVRLDRGRWWQLPTPPRDPLLGHFLLAIDGTSSRDVWAAGYETPGDASRVPLMLHWDGQGWTRFEVPLPLGDYDGAINGMVVVAPDDAWAVGTSVGGRQDTTFIAHWDGHEWTARTELISLHSREMVLWGIDAAGPDDVWAVGAAGDGPGILHWNGQVWSWVHSEVEIRSNIDLLYGVSAISRDDAWAVGGHGTTYPPGNARLMHWDGTRWSEAKAPTPGENRYLTAVSGSSSDDVWAVGSFRRTGENIRRHLVLHWDGERWSRIPTHGDKAP